MKKVVNSASGTGGVPEVPRARAGYAMAPDYMWCMYAHAIVMMTSSMKTLFIAHHCILLSFRG